MVLLDMNDTWAVNKGNILYKCGWSPFEGQHFRTKVKKTFVSGHPAFDNGFFNENKSGLRLSFER
jgi:dihydroorotase